MTIKNSKKNSKNSNKIENKNNENDKNKKNKKNKHNFFKDFTKQFKEAVAEEQQIVEEGYNVFSTKLADFIKVFIASGKKFLEDDCMTKASAIAYTTIISLIPILTVSLSIFSRGGNNFFIKIQNYLVEHNLDRVVNDEIFRALEEFFNNAKSIGIIGSVFLIFSATAILRTFEKSLNNIWKIKKRRPMYLKIIYYWAILTLGPLLIIAGTSITTQISKIINKPDYYSIYADTSNIIWVAGSKSDIKKIQKNNLSKNNTNIDDSISNLSLDNINIKSQTSYEYDDINSTFKVSDNDINVKGFSKVEFHDIDFNNNYGWIIGENGIILRSVDYGKSWNVIKIDNFNLIGIHMNDTNSGFMLTSNGYFLETEDGGITWNITKINNNKNRLNSFKIYGENIYVVCDNGYMLNSNDKGLTWKSSQISASKYKDEYRNLYSIDMYDNNNGLLCGEDGLILKTKNGGQLWSDLSYKRYNYYSIIYYSQNKFFVSGEKGALLSYDFNLKSWKYLNFKSQAINKIIYNNKNLWITGESGLLMYTSDEGNTWHGTKGTSWIMYFLNFFAPFVVMWICFLLLYFAVPNIPVPFKAAAIGASFTGSVWVIFTMLFTYYVRALANTTFAIYGAVAAIPIFLLLIYASTIIILFGAEVAYTLMYPDTYKKLNKRKRKTSDIRIINGIRIVHLIYKNFESGKGFTTYKSLIPICSNRINEADYFIDTFLKENFISQNDNSDYIPTTSSKNILLKTIIDSIHDTSLDLYATSSDSVRKNLAEKFKQMNESRAKIIGNETLYDLINN